MDTSFWLRKKPINAFILQDSGSNALARNLSLLDLLMFGIGGSVGSGVFVLSGLVANRYSGPSVVVSFLLAGLSCCFSAASYGELSCIIPSAGTSYAYAYHALGEYFAVIAAWCLFLEYGISGAALARAWGDKICAWLVAQDMDFSLCPVTHNFNFIGGFLQLLCVLVTLCGGNVSKVVINCLTALKIIVIAFMVITALYLIEPRNLVPMAPFGVSGILRGTTACMFSFVGYDEVCCLAAEAKCPQHNLPIAVFGTILLVTFIYCCAALSLTGLQHYSQLSPENGFSSAFDSRGYIWAANLSMAGEIISLPLVVFISFVAQPRIQYAMSRDGLLPALFSEVDNCRVMRKGVIFAGFICILISIISPFRYLDDMISAGVLFSCNITNTSLILVRRSYGASAPACCNSLAGFHVMALIFSLSASRLPFSNMLFDYSSGIIMLELVILIAFACFIDRKFPGYATRRASLDRFRVVGVPYIPLLGITINYLLIAQLDFSCILLLMAYLILGTLIYIFVRHSSIYIQPDWDSQRRAFQPSK